MYKTAVIGGRSDVFGFAVVGVECFFAEDTQSAERIFKRLTAENSYAVIFITEQYFRELSEEIERAEKSTFTSVVGIPQCGDGINTGTLKLDEIIVRAIGNQLEVE